MTGNIKKRSGEIVAFAPEKITIAVGKAFTAVHREQPAAMLGQITELVVNDLNRFFPDQTPSVEDVQNVVENVLMGKGFYDAGKAYIIYRYEHAREREEQKRALREKIERSEVTVVKRDGRKEKFSAKKLKKSLNWAIKPAEKEVDPDLIVAECEANLADDMTTAQISQALVLAARSLIERDPAYSQVASRLLLRTVYQQAISREKIDYKEFEPQYRQAFIANLRRGVELGRLDPLMLSFDLEALSRRLVLGRDDLFMYLGSATLYDRYFLRESDTKRVLETPQAFWMRVAMGLALKDEQREAMVLRFYEVMSTLRFVPSTPTLFHAGTTHPQLSSCYLTTVNDALDHIFKCIGDNAQLSKWSGGVANDWTNLRATGALIKGTGVESQGVIPFLKIANDTTVAINRSGRRRGATVAYLETWHYDFEDFLELRKNTGDERRRTHDMNTAAWIPDLFIKRVKLDGYWTLFSPDDVPDLHHLYGQQFEKRYTHYERSAQAGTIKLSKRVKAKELWKKMIMMLFETGHPWMTFKDPSNLRSPQDHMGVVHSSNLCTEITLNTSEDETAVCNLGSVNLAKHVAGKKFDVDRVKDTVTVAMRMLDNVIDINFYPTKEAASANLKHRPVGLGIMGYQDALYLQGIQFDSMESVEFADHSMEVISYSAILASADLARERGTYRTYKGSKWDRGIFPLDTLQLLEDERGEHLEVDRSSRLDWHEVREAVQLYGMRNSNCMAIAPTATIANIAGCYPSIEPIYKNAYVKSNMSGEFIIVNRYLVADLKALGLWNPAMLAAIKGHDGSVTEIAAIPQALQVKYKEVFEIEPEWLVRVAAHRGKWIDQSQSLNLFIKGTSGKRIADTYLYAWATGLKTTYYLRTLAASGIEKSTLDLGQQRLKSTIAHEVVAATVTVAQPEAVLAPLESSRPERAPVATKERLEQPAILPKLLLCKIDDPTCEACQ